VPVLYFRGGPGKEFSRGAGGNHHGQMEKRAPPKPTLPITPNNIEKEAERALSTDAEQLQSPDELYTMISNFFSCLINKDFLIGRGPLRK